LRQAILSQNIRESHGPGTRRSSNAAPSVSSGVELPTRFRQTRPCSRHAPRPLSALQILLHRLRITSRQSTSPDVHFDEHWQLFLQFEDDRAFGKNVTTPVDQDPLDLGAIGIGAVVGAFTLPSMKAALGSDRLVAVGTLGTAFSLVLLRMVRYSTALQPALSRAFHGSQCSRASTSRFRCPCRRRSWRSTPMPIAVGC
jgi:hypothetical protein